MRAPPVPVRSVSAPQTRLTRITLSGRPDYRHEITLTGRTRNGSPGVNIVTPVRIAGTDTAVLVNRGWVYSPDASQVDLARWREADSLTVSGYVDTLAPGLGSPSSDLRMRTLNQRRIEMQLPYPIAQYFVVALAEGSPSGREIPIRLPLPALDEGPHKSYAIQWFSFATIAIVGTLGYLLTARRSKPDNF